MNESTKHDRVWHKGPPPHVGWWNASSTRTAELWRWWDGKMWSRPSREEGNPHNAALHAARADDIIRQESIEWCDYWPEGARCGRFSPETGYITGGAA